MARKPEKVFSRTFTTKARRDSIDQDYLDKLSPEELKWLAQFTDEYYGASFQKNPAFAKKAELIKMIKSEIKAADTETKVKKWTSHLDRVSSQKGSYIQVSENDTKAHNVDLRKCRKIQLYYKNENGRFSKKKSNKYSDDNIIDPNNSVILKECNDRNNEMKRCVLNSGNRLDIDRSDMEDLCEYHSPEDQLLRYEQELLDDELDDLIVEHCNYCCKLTPTLDIAGGDCAICGFSKVTPR